LELFIAVHAIEFDLRPTPVNSITYDMAVEIFQEIRDRYDSWFRDLLLGALQAKTNTVSEESLLNAIRERMFPQGRLILVLQLLIKA
jgi:hypothetical protein